MQGANPASGPASSLSTCPRPWLIGVLHLPALPMAPGASLPVTTIAARAADDARVLAEHGFTAVLVENFHDTPFRRSQADPETIAAMAIVTASVVAAVDLPVGVNVLRNDALGALAVATAAGAGFVRVNVLAGSAATDQGLVHGVADELARRRASLRSDVAVLADVDVKHATSLDTRPLPLRARDLVARAGADAVLVTGPATGRAVDLEQLGEVAGAVAPAPVLAASGTTPRELAAVLARCAGAIVGTAIKHPDTGRIDPTRAAAWVDAARA
jgi:hypothetical protein